MTIEEHKDGFYFSQGAWIQQDPLLMLKVVIRFDGGRRPFTGTVSESLSHCIKSIQKSIGFRTPIRIGEAVSGVAGVVLFRVVDIVHDQDGEYCITVYMQETT